MYQFATAQETSTSELAVFFQKFQKTVHALRVNETKVTARNAFIGNLFALESKKKSKNDKRTFFGDFLLIFELSVNT